MADPIDGVYGALMVTGWIAPGPPDGAEYPWLLLTTPDERAPRTMPLVAEALGIPGGPRVRVEVATYGGEDWARIVPEAVTEVWERPVPTEWVELARERQAVIVAVGFAPLGYHSDGDDIEAYTQMVGRTGQATLARVPLG